MPPFGGDQIGRWISIRQFDSPVLMHVSDDEATASMTDETLRDTTATVIPEERIVKGASDSCVGDVDSPTRLHCSRCWHRIYRLDGLSVDHNWHPQQDEGLVAGNGAECARAR